MDKILGNPQDMRWHKIDGLRAALLTLGVSREVELGRILEWWHVHMLLMIMQFKGALSEQVDRLVRTSPTLTTRLIAKYHVGILTWRFTMMFSEIESRTSRRLRFSLALRSYA